MSTDGRRLIAEMVSGVALTRRGDLLGADSQIDLRGLVVPLFRCSVVRGLFLEAAIGGLILNRSSGSAA